MVGDRDTVRVAPDVIHHLLGSVKGRLGVDDPFDLANTIEMPAEDLGISVDCPRSVAGRRTKAPEVQGRDQTARQTRPMPCASTTDQNRIILFPSGADLV
jgi:hypothetical protein